MSLIAIQGLFKSYDLLDSSIDVIKDLDLSIEEGEFVVIFGKSGSGKSTLISLMAGLERPSSGKIFFDGQDIKDFSENKLADFRRSNIGIVFQHFHLIESMTAFENIELPMIISGVNHQKRKKKVLELLSLVQLEKRTLFFPNELSGGERQRVAIARALANKAKVIIADEPTGDLDSMTGKAIIDLLFDLNKGANGNDGLNWKPTVIMVTHDTSLIRDGMRIINLSDGKIVQN